MGFLNMSLLAEEVAIYAAAGGVITLVLILYARSLRHTTRITEEKIERAIEHGLHEPVSLHPEIDVNTCIQSGACIEACPEKDIIGIRHGKATLINASRCVGHGACFHACPVEAISLVIGTEKRGVDLPHIKPDFETNVAGIYIAGELGGMGLIKNSVEQGRQAMENLARNLNRHHSADHDVVIVGAGPAGISASLEARRLGLNAVTLEQDTLGGTVFSFPRAKIVMTSPMHLPLFGKVKLTETSKGELLDLWQRVLKEHEIQIQENSKVESIAREGDVFAVRVADGRNLRTRAVLIAIGRRGTPRKLNVPGENLEKVAYRLLEPEHIRGKNILVVGGGDSAIESALLLAEQNALTLSYRGESFGRIKPKNSERIQEAARAGRIDILFSSTVARIEESTVWLALNGGQDISLPNDLVYIFAGGELPTDFLEKAGITISKRFGFALLTPRRKRT